MERKMIYQIRRQKGITQEKMAESLGMCRETYNRMEKNPENITIKDAVAISEILGVPLENIFFTKDSH